QPPIYRSPVGGRARVASHFRIRRWLPQVRELFLIVFAGQRGCLFPHLRVSYCWIKECRTSLTPATQSSHLGFLGLACPAKAGAAAGRARPKNQERAQLFFARTCAAVI